MFSSTIGAPIPSSLELARAGKVVLTPHMGSATLEGRIEMGETVIVNIRTFLDGHTPPHRVLPEERIQADRPISGLKPEVQPLAGAKFSSSAWARSFSATFLCCS